MPWFKINGKGARSLVSALINITRGVVVNAKHWKQSIRIAISTGNVGATGTNTVNIQTNTTGAFGNQGTSLYLGSQLSDAKI